MMSTIVETKSLTQRFKSLAALDELNVSFLSGVTGLIGANGAGKTTLLGLRNPTSGSVRVLGLDPVTEGTKLRSQVALAPEHNIMPDAMRAIDFVCHMAEMRGLPRKEARIRASDMLWLVGLGEERLRELGTLSTGQRQRVKLAQAVAPDPRLVFLDEPTDGLDPVQRGEMLKLISKISSKFSIDVVLSSHVLEEVGQVCDNVVVLESGRLVTCGTLKELEGDDSGVVLELVDVTEPPDTIDSVEAELRRGGLEVQREDVILSITGTELDELYDRVRDAVSEAGARISRLEPKRRTLEDLYGRIVG